MKRQAVQYTVRGVPTEVDRVLRAKAAKRKTSLNQIILEELSTSTVGGLKRTDFSDLVGRWIPDEAFDEIVELQRRIDSDDWK